jgi:hypothetical protein
MIAMNPSSKKPPELTRFLESQRYQEELMLRLQPVESGYLSTKPKGGWQPGWEIDSIVMPDLNDTLHFTTPHYNFTKH